MTKEGVLQDIKKLYDDIDVCVSDLLEAKKCHNTKRIETVHWTQEGLLVNAMQELSFLMNYINEKVNE